MIRTDLCQIPERVVSTKPAFLELLEGIAGGGLDVYELSVDDGVDMSFDSVDRDFVLLSLD
jgi:hypothetical protein